MSRQVVIEDESDGSFTLDGWLKHFIDDIHNFQSPTLAIDRSSGHREILISLERQKNNSNGDKFRHEVEEFTVEDPTLRVERHATSVKERR